MIHGNPLKQNTWKRLDAILTKQFVHESGVDMTIARTFIDSGFLPRSVYDYIVRKPVGLGVFPCKGRWGSYPLVEKPQQKKGNGREMRSLPLYLIGVDEGQKFLKSNSSHFKDMKSGSDARVYALAAYNSFELIEN